jgi:hypothetical protein
MIHDAFCSPHEEFDYADDGTNEHATNSNTGNTNAPTVTAEHNVLAISVTVEAHLWFLVIEDDRIACHD